MNGCCMTHADGPGHCHNCYWYWPCGCDKERSKPGATAKPHRHVHEYREPEPEKRCGTPYTHALGKSVCTKVLPCIRHGKLR